MMRFNKKGLVEDWADLVFMVFFGLFLFFFLNGIMQEGVRAKEEQSLRKLESLQGEEIMQAYLRTPVEGKTVAGLILESRQDDAALRQLQAATRELATSADNRLFQGIDLEYQSGFRQSVFFDTLSPELVSSRSLQALPADGQSVTINLYRER